MTDKWQPGKTYVPGSLVVPRAAPTPTNFRATNGYFEDGDTGWDYTGGNQYSATGGYGSAKCCTVPGSTTGGVALNQAKFTMPAGMSIKATCMIQQGASDVDHTRGYAQIYFYDSSDAQIGEPVSGNIVNDGRGGAWHPSTVTAKAPGGTSYARAGIYLYQNSADPIWGDNLVVESLAPVIPDGLVFKATQADPGKSGSQEPVWPTMTGIEVTDNEVTWEGVIATSITWKATPLLKSGASEPTWPTDVGAAVRDGTINWTAISRRIDDENCPQSKVVAIMASKVFAADKDIVRFSATVNPLDWSSEQDAGYLPTGLQQANANDMAVLAPYRSNLTAFNASSFQNWQVDPDPAAMALLDQMEGIGSTWQLAAHPVGNELFYLSALGVRSVSVAAGSDSLKAGDVGMPIDSLVQDAIRVALANSSGVRATYYPGAGQYWIVMSGYPVDPFAISGDLADGPTGVAVDFTYNLAGGIKPYGALTVTSGALPAGLSMDATGHVTGSVTTGGSYAWTVGAVDGAGTAASLTDSAAFYVPATFDPTRNVNGTLSAGNTIVTLASGANAGTAVNTNKTSGKWYVEFSEVVAAVFGQTSCIVTSRNSANPILYNTGSSAGSFELHSDGDYFDNGVRHASAFTWAAAGNAIGIAFDAVTREIWVRGPSGWMFGADPSTNPSPFVALPDNGVGVTAGIAFNNVTGTSPSVRMNDGQAAFVYPVPPGFSPLSTP